jgi:YHS domain-containing protein
MNVRRVTVAGIFVLAACASEPAAQVTRNPDALAPIPTSAPAAQTPEPAPTAAPAERAQASITRVDPELVCMVNNHYMGKAQIPVEVDGKTYFGCCEMCKTKLAEDPQSRAARDPVSGATVDKAVAIIGREVSGTVVYFENEQNLQRYAGR